jgi:predicted  nucleic acid-binding Zn-ribbon protein
MKEMMRALFIVQSLELKTSRVTPAEKQTILDLREKVSAPILAHYDRLRSRGKNGVAIAKQSVCSECHMRIPTGVLVTLMHGQDVQLCGSCGRYLYLPEPEAGERSPSTEPAESTGRKRKTKTPALVH